MTCNEHANSILTTHWPRICKNAFIIISLIVEDLFYFYLCIWLLVPVCRHICVLELTEARGIGCSGAGITGSCEQLDVGAGNWTLLLWKGSSALNPSAIFPPLPFLMIGGHICAKEITLATLWIAAVLRTLQPCTLERVQWLQHIFILFYFIFQHIFRKGWLPNLAKNPELDSSDCNVY